MQVKVLCIALVGLSLAVAVAANVADSDSGAEKVAVHDKCGAKGGHCEVASGCGGRTLKGLCDDNGSGSTTVCCVPGKRAKKGKGLSPKQLAAKRKARAAAAKKQAKAAKAADAAMAAQTAMAKALAKDLPAGKTLTQPSAADAEKAQKEGAAVAKAAAPQPPAKAKGKKAHKGKGKRKAKKALKKLKKAAKKGKKSNTKKLGMRANQGSRGIDVAQKTTKKHWQCLKKAGWDWAVVRGFRASNRPDPHAARSLKLAAKAGFGRRKLGVYLYPCAKCGDAKGQVDRMVKHLKNHGAHRLFSTIWLDVEGRFWPAPKPTKKHRAAALAARRAAAVAAAKVNGPAGVVAPPPPLVKKPKQSSRYGEARAFFRSLVKACRAHKRYRCGVYTSGAQWKSIMGKRPIRMAKKMPLWYPQFDVTPSAETGDFEGFSGWDKAWAKQYSENQNVCGLSVDVNVRA